MDPYESSLGVEIDAADEPNGNGNRGARSVEEGKQQEEDADEEEGSVHQYLPASALAATNHEGAPPAAAVNGAPASQALIPVAFDADQGSSGGDLVEV